MNFQLFQSLTYLSHNWRVEFLKYSARGIREWGVWGVWGDGGVWGVWGEREFMLPPLSLPRKPPAYPMPNY
ncbi:MAG: hypothetical protein FWK04_19325 [Nostoc sp. GBBB01]|nr:hypothetical protein [Nostoc sp. GBBB01]